MRKRLAFTPNTTCPAPRSCSLLLILALLLISTMASAQQVWNKTYIEDRPIMLFSAVQADTGGYTIIGGTYGYINNLGKGLAVRIDLDGDVKRYKVFVDSVYVSYATIFNSLIPISNDKVAFTGYSYDSLAYLLLCIANKEIDSVQVFRYYTPNTSVFHGQALAQLDGMLYVTGVRTDSSTNNPNIFFVKVDTNGNRLVEKSYGTTWYEQATSITPLQNGNLMLGCVRSNLNFNPSNQKANTWLLEVDTGGNIVRQWFDPSDSTYAAEGLRQTSDGGFIYGARKKNYQSGSSSVSYSATIVKMDSDFNKIWTITRGGSDLSIYTSFTDIEELPDGRFIVSGHLTSYGTDTSLNGSILKLDKDGNVIWEKYYRGISTSQSLNFLTDIDVLPDGSLIAVGQCQLAGVTPLQVGWMLKLDSNGCEIENCLVSSPLIPSSEATLMLYPNPAPSYLTIKTDETGELYLYNQIGQLLYKNTIWRNTPIQLDVSTYTSGVYYYRFQQADLRETRGKWVKE